MFRQFLRRSVTLVGAGIILGLTARFILGDPNAGANSDRTFQRPVETAAEAAEVDSGPDFPLLPDLEADEPPKVDSPGSRNLR